MTMCIFCKIVKGEIPNNTVHENDEFLAFHDLYPKAPVHVLIIPKVHVENFQSVDADTMAKITPFMQEVARKTGLDVTGYRLITRRSLISTSICLEAENSSGTTNTKTRIKVYKHRWT